MDLEQATDCYSLVTLTIADQAHHLVAKRPMPELHDTRAGSSPRPSAFTLASMSMMCATVAVTQNLSNFEGSGRRTE